MLSNCIEPDPLIQIIVRLIIICKAISWSMAKHS
jgi:hypothetical protein